MKARLLVMSKPGAPELSVLESLPPEMKVVGIGRSPEDFSGHPLPHQRPARSHFAAREPRPLGRYLCWLR